MCMVVSISNLRKLRNLYGKENIPYGEFVGKKKAGRILHGPAGVNLLQLPEIPDSQTESLP